MQLFVTVLHVCLCLFLILIILLQPGKEGAAAFGGGGGNQSYGPRGKAHVLGRATTVVAALFMVTSITLAWWSNQSTKSGSDIDDDIKRLESEQKAAGGTDADDALPPVESPPPPVDAPTPDASSGEVVQPGSTPGDAGTSPAPGAEGASTNEEAPTAP